MKKTVALKSGEELVIRVVEPPLGKYAKEVGCWRDVREDLLRGEFVPWLFTPYFIGEIDGKVAGSMSYYVDTEKRGIGVVEFVQTDERHRGKGIATALMEELIGRFRDDGGKALYLCTTNPIAGHLYERHGFWYHVGDGMRYLAPEAQDFDDTYWSYCGRALVREATWGDLPELSALYNHPEPNWMIKDHLTQSYSETRYESHFVKIMRRIEDGRGAYFVLENPDGHVVGAAAMERANTFVEQHVATLVFRATIEYEEQVGELLDAVAERAVSLSIRTLQIPIAECDRNQCKLAELTGFTEEACLKDRLRSREGYTDLLIYSKTLAEKTEPYRKIDDYYGTRKEWQWERVKNPSDSAV